MSEVERIAALPYPFADWTVIPIVVTGNVWYRQKLPGESWRTIMAISIVNQEIVVHAILMRDDNTYATVRRLWERTQS